MVGEAWVSVPVTGLWRAPDRTRSVDEAFLRDRPDHGEWLRGMDAATDREQDGRLGLYDRLDSELSCCEPVVVQESVEGWSRVSCPLQPAASAEGGYAGYRGWVRSAHLASTRPEHAVTVGDRPLDAEEFVDRARRHLGLPYLWGGLTEEGLDCSGLVHHAARELGVVLPRDAHDQHTAARSIAAGEERFGDLYFFAHPGKNVHHVGIVISPGTMLHAPESGAHVVEESLGESRRRTLVGAGRFTS